MSTQVFLLPHPDDEFAVAFTIRDACLAGDRVCIVFLTDGGFGGQDVYRREQESVGVLQSIGVGIEEIHFIGRSDGIPDGRLHEHLERASSSVANTLITLGQADVIFVPAWEGGHQDHDAAHLIGINVARMLHIKAIRQFPLYRAVGRIGPFFRVLLPLVENGPVITRCTSWSERCWHPDLCLGYRSQWRSWLGLWPLTLLHHLLDGGFTNQPVSTARIQGAPHQGLPLYTRRGFLDLEEFLSATADFRHRLQHSP